MRASSTTDPVIVIHQKDMPAKLNGCGMIGVATTPAQVPTMIGITTDNSLPHLNPALRPANAFRAANATNNRSAMATTPRNDATKYSAWTWSKVIARHAAAIAQASAL